MLAGALALFNAASAGAQNDIESQDNLREQEQKIERQQTEAAKRQVEAAKAQAEAAKQQAEAIKRQAEAAREDSKRQSDTGQRERDQAEKAREMAALAMEKAQMEVQKATEIAAKAKLQALDQIDLSGVDEEVAKAIAQARQAAEKAISKSGLSGQIEEEVKRALQAADAAVAGRRYAQAAKPPPAPPAPGAAPAAPAPPAAASTPKPSPYKRSPSSLTIRRPAVRTLVVSPKSSDAKALANIEEDLSVMWRILDKETERELGKDGGEHALGIFISPSESRGPNAVLLDGFGALFTLSVRFPLVAPPKAKEEKKGEPPADTTWEKTKRELFGAPDNAWGDPKVKFFHSEYSRPETAYDAGKVEALKTALLEVLKNATNLRNVQPDEYISVAVLGGGTGAGDVFLYKGDTANRFDKSAYSVTTTSTAGAAVIASSEPIDLQAQEILLNRAEGRNSTLTIRVKKSDVDNFAKGKTTLEEFRKKAAINIY